MSQCSEFTLPYLPLPPPPSQFCLKEEVKTLFQRKNHLEQENKSLRGKHLEAELAKLYHSIQWFVLCELVQITSYKLHSFQFPFANGILGELRISVQLFFFPDPFILAHAIGILQLCICSDWNVQMLGYVCSVVLWSS